jgi:hypothetical protein
MIFKLYEIIQKLFLNIIVYSIIRIFSFDSFWIQKYIFSNIQEKFRYVKRE